MVLTPAPLEYVNRIQMTPVNFQNTAIFV